MNGNIINQAFCMDDADFFKSISDESVHVVITDPPYGINYQNHYTHKKHKKINNDTEPFSYDLLGQEAFRILMNNSALFAFTGWSVYPQHFVELSKYFNMKEPIICQKRPAGSASDLKGTFQPNADWCMFGHKGKFQFKPTQLLKNKRAGTVPNIGRKPVPLYKTRFPACWFGSEYPMASENSAFQKQRHIFHPTIKGLDFIKWLILLTTNENDVVVDPYAGTGTIAVAAQQLNRRFIVNDNDATNYQYILQRIKENK